MSWISVKDRMPDELEEFRELAQILIVVDKQTEHGFFHRSGVILDANLRKVNATHWMPLPEPPEVDHDK